MTPLAVTAPLVRRRTVRASKPRPSAVAEVTLRAGTQEDAVALHSLITAHVAEGHLLPRRLDEISAHARRFVVAVQQDRIVACGELAPLSRTVAEIRSLVVDPEVRSEGVGARIVDELRLRARAGGYDQLCAFTHTPQYFVHLGFSIVPHAWLPEKIVTDCAACPQFRRCGQYAMTQTLVPTRRSTLTAPRG